MDTVDNVIPEPDKLAEINNLIAAENPPKAPEKMVNTPNENHPSTAPQKPVNMPKPKEKKKRGSPGDFQGQQLQFLLAFMPSYVVKSKNKIRKKRGTADNIWDEFFVNYWSSFPWCLPLSQDPSEDGVDYVCPPVDEEERAAKTELMQKMKSKIKSWFNRQRTAVGLAGNPFSEWLSRLWVPEGPAPRHLPDYQFYMQHSDHKATELLEGENQAVKDEIREAAATEHVEQMAAHKDALEGLPALDEEGQHEAREHFSTLVAPLLAGLKAHTGYEISLFAGRVNAVKGLDVQVMSLHAGVTNDTPTHKDLSKADPKVYGEMLMHFSRFICGSHFGPEAEGSASGKMIQAVPAAALGTAAVPVNPATDSFDPPLTTMSRGHIPSPDISPLQNPVPAPLREPSLPCEPSPPREPSLPRESSPLRDPLANVSLCRTIGTNLRTSLLTMSQTERSANLSCMRFYSETEMIRENAIVRNKLMLMQLGLDKPFSSWAGAETAVSGKIKGFGQGRSKKKKVKKIAEAEYDQDDEDGDEDGQEGSEEEGETVPPPQAPRVPHGVGNILPSGDRPDPAATPRRATRRHTPPPHT